MLQTQSDTALYGVPAASHGLRLSSGRVCAILIAIATTLMAWHLCHYLAYAIKAIRYPFELDYGEGIVWQQAILIPGPRMYGDINHYPFIVFHYPPLYHLVVRGLALLGANILMAGRSVSVASTLVLAAVVASLSFQVSRDEAVRPAALAGAVVAGLSVFCYWPVVAWSPLFRVDMLATALSFLGVWCAVRSADHPRLLYVALIVFVLAVYTKQSSLAAPLATVPIMLLTDRARTIKACVLGFSLALAALAVLMWLTHGNFLRHIILYNLNRYYLRTVFIALAMQSWEIVFLALAVAGLCVGWRSLAAKGPFANLGGFGRHLRDNPSSLTRATLILYFAMSTATLAMLGKSGGCVNYFIEWMCVWSPWIGYLTTILLQESPGAANLQSRLKWPVASFIMPVLLICQVLIMPSSAAAAFRLNDSERNEQLGQLLAKVEQARRPVLSDDMVLLMKAGKTVPWEPAIFAELAATGQWNDRLLTRLIANQVFAFVLTTGMPGQPLYDSRFDPAVSHAIAVAYPVEQSCAGMIVHVPSGRREAGKNDGCRFTWR